MQFRRILLTLGTLAVAALVMAVILRSQPGPVSASGFAAVTTGGEHTCALTVAGGVLCFGLGVFGQLGDDTATNSTTPVDVFGLTSGAAAIDAGHTHTCAVTTTGGVKCWGNNDMGRLGDGTTIQRNTPVDVSGLTSGVAAVSAGFSHTCAVTTTGGVKCWGQNDSGALGDGTRTSSSVPVDVSGLSSGVASVSLGLFHTCAVTTTGGVKCWGDNRSGELGNGTMTSSSVPVDVLGLTSGVVAVSAGNDHNCALTTTGGVKCWGDNSRFQVGAETTEDCDPDPEFVRPCTTAPVDVTGLHSGVAALSVGEAHTCVLTTASGVRCWGDNTIGQLGDGTTTTRLIPAAVFGLTIGVAAIDGRFTHVCAIATAGGVTCWGSNISGQLGPPTNETCPFVPCSTTPVDVFLEPKPTPVPTPTPCPARQVPANGGCAAPTKTPTPTPTPCPTAKVPVGGGCAPHNFWDFFDVWTEPGPARDLRVDGFDINAVASRFGTAPETPLTKEEAVAQALTPPVNNSGYHTASDRDAPEPGANVWNVREPNGFIDGFDIGMVVVQFGHTCG